MNTMKRTIEIPRERVLEFVEPYLHGIYALFQEGYPGSACSSRLVGETWWAWIVAVECVLPREPEGERVFEAQRPIIYGLGPTLVDKFTGAVHYTGSGTDLASLERELGYRPWWKIWGTKSLWSRELYSRESDKAGE